MKKLFLSLFAATLLIACGDQNANNQENEETTDEATTELIQDGVSMEGTIQMTPADLWANLSSFGGLEKVHPNLVSSSTLEGEGVGAKRTFVLADGSGEVVQELTKLDAENMLLEYKTISTPMPVADYVATMQIAADEENENSATLKWTSTYKVSQEEAEETKNKLTGIYETAVANLNKLALASAEEPKKEE